MSNSTSRSTRLSATIDQIAPQLGPTFDGVTRLSRSLNNRNESLAELLKTAGRRHRDIVQTQRTGQCAHPERQRSDQGFSTTVGRPSSACCRTRHAVSRALTGVVADNEKELAPTLERLNRVNAVLRRTGTTSARRCAVWPSMRSPRASSSRTARTTTRPIPNLQPGADSFSRSSTTRSASGAASAQASRRTPPGHGPSFRSPSTVFRNQETFRNDGNSVSGWWPVAAIALAVASGRRRGLPGCTRCSSGRRPITAYFPTATSIYPGDEVRVSGVKVGKIDSIKPEGTQTKMTLKVDRDVPIPADAKAVIVAQNLIAARYVQLTPAYRNSGGRMDDGAVIPSRPHRPVPVEWDEVKTQLKRLATELGPTQRVSQVRRSAGSSTAPPTRWTTATARSCGRHCSLQCRSGTGARRGQRQHRRHHQEPADLRHRAARRQAADRPVRESAGDADQRGQRQQVRSGRRALWTCQWRSAKFSDSSREAASQTSEQIRSLASSVTQNLVDNRMALENVLHITPNALANARVHLLPGVPARFQVRSCSPTSSEPGAGSSAG